MLSSRSWRMSHWDSMAALMHVPLGQIAHPSYRHQNSLLLDPKSHSIGGRSNSHKGGKNWKKNQNNAAISNLAVFALLKLTQNISISSQKTQNIEWICDRIKLRKIIPYVEKNRITSRYPKVRRERQFQIHLHLPEKVDFGRGACRFTAERTKKNKNTKGTFAPKKKKCPWIFFFSIRASSVKIYLFFRWGRPNLHPPFLPSDVFFHPSNMIQMDDRKFGLTSPKMEFRHKIISGYPVLK